MNGNQHYLDRVTSEHRGKPRFTAWLTTLLDLADHTAVIAQSVPDAFDVMTAVGAQLDVIGELVGINRSVTERFINLPDGAQLDDEAFRRLILAKIVQNQWDGRNETISETWADAMRSSLGLEFHDNQDMTVSVDLTGDYTPLDVELVLRGYIVPRPMGVKMITNMRSRASAPIKVYVRHAFYGASATIRFVAT